MSTDAYTAKEFADAFWKRGYGKKKQAVAWLIENNITAATEDDFMNCYYATQSRPIYRHNSRYTALHVDGQNPVCTSNVPNSYGKSFAAQMAEENYEMDKLNRWIKRKHEEANKCS